MTLTGPRETEGQNLLDKVNVSPNKVHRECLFQNVLDLHAFLVITQERIFSTTIFGHNNLCKDLKIFFRLDRTCCNNFVIKLNCRLWLKGQLAKNG